jgi:hypothetical protein
MMAKVVRLLMILLRPKRRLLNSSKLRLKLNRQDLAAVFQPNLLEVGTKKKSSNLHNIQKVKNYLQL